MTRGQQIVLLVLIFSLLVVTGLLVYTLINSSKAASPVPTLTIRLTDTVPPTPPLNDTPALRTVPPTWTPPPTRTPPLSSTPRPTGTATPLPTITRTFAPTFTPRPTVTPSLPGPTTTAALQNPGFQGIRDDTIPGWSWWAEDNFAPGGEYNPDTSYETPLFKQADDPVRRINGPTLQIDAVQHLKFKVYIYQTVPVSPTLEVGFQVMAGAFSGSGAIKVAAGIDARGGRDCNAARWSDLVFLNQDSGVQRIVAPQVIASNTGQITVCLYAEPLYPAISNAVFFDDAELIVNPE
jgi:hypothetical protein